METRSVLEAASWRLASTLARRHPILLVTREHPGGGQYDVLTIRSDAGCDIMLNRVGTIQIHGRHDGNKPAWRPMSWTDALSHDPRDLIHSLEGAAGLPTVPSLPPSTPKVLVYRAISALAGMQLLAAPAEIRMGYFDSSGEESGPADWVHDFPDIPARIASQGRRDTYEVYSDYWEYTSKDVRLAFDANTSDAWTEAGNRANLYQTYIDAERSMPRLLAHMLQMGAR